MRSRILLSVVLCGLLHRSGGEETCDANGVCKMSEAAPQQQFCDLPEAFCDSGSSSSIYSHGGTAQAYKARAPSTSSVCDPTDYASSSLRTATWPFSRSSRGKPPSITFKINLMSCSEPLKGNNCCCQTIQDSNAQVEVWQARPDGTYSSLRHGVEEGDCRAASNATDTSSPLVFETVAPGSTGALGGLGPSKWEFLFYGPPVIHFLATAPGHAPTLIDLPVLLDKKLAARSYRWPDWRGSAWNKHSDPDPPVQIVSWKGNAKKNKVDIELNIYLLQAQDDGQDADVSSLLCQSWLPSLPSNFFLEPISECAPSMLDFFAL